MKQLIVLYDIDSRIPNFALMKISSYYKNQGCEVILSRCTHGIKYLEADKYYASTVFSCYQHSQKCIQKLREYYAENIEIGGSGIDLKKRLLPEIENCFPDYQLYGHDKYAIGFLTRGCYRRCPFCLVPLKEGKIRRVDTFDNFVPARQSNVMLLDDNLLSYSESEALLSEIIEKNISVNFSQSLDISYVNDYNYQLIKQIDSRNARFNKKMYYFSCNNTKTIDEFINRERFLRDLGKGAVTVIVMFGYNTSLSEDYQILLMLKNLRLIPFLQEYMPIPGVSAKMPDNYFDYDLNEVIKLRFISNGYNWEKYLKWVNNLYYSTFGKYYLPLLEILFRYNNKHKMQWYRARPKELTKELYRIYR
ncbi:MAG: hypothetical protein WCY82_05675 [Desulfotomaculaceae bacterium]